MLKRISALALATFMMAVLAGSTAQASVSVKFQVNIGALLQSGTFDATTDSVLIRGDFQMLAGDTTTWGGTMFTMAKSATNDSVYVLDVAFPDSAVGDTIQYKYVIHNSSSDTWESISDRAYTITSAATQELPMAYFNNQMPGVVVTVNITFVADMSHMLAEGFNPSIDSVYVVGGNPPLNWGYAAGETMTPSFENPNLYETTMQFTGIIGATVNFKLFGAGTDPFSNGGWESGDNHQFPFPSADTAVTWTPNLHVTKPSSSEDVVTFHVDMNNAYDGINYKAINNVKGVWITGSVRPLNWPSSGWPLADTIDESSGIDTTATLHRMYDDGTHGDSLAGDNRWTITLTFSPGVSSYVEYKYGAMFDGYDTLTIGGVVSKGSLIDNESRTGVNHTMVLDGTSQSIYNHFGDMDPNNPGTAGGQTQVGVKFQVNIGALLQSGTFDATTDSVLIRGDFQKLAGDTTTWGGTMFTMAKSTTNDSIYVLTVAFPDSAVGDTIQYKYVIHNSSSDTWESTSDRAYTITSAATQELPMAYFNNQKPGVVKTLNITFVADMSHMLAEGFNPSVDSVYVVGGNPPLNWGYAAGATMTPSFDNPNLYETTMEFTGIIGATVNFKLFGAGTDPFSNGGWESGDNHQFPFPSADTSVTWTPNLHVTKPSSESDVVIFHVDMNNAYDGINYKPINNVKGVWITGSVAPLNWPPSGWPLADTVDESSGIDTTAQLHRMYDDGTHGDSLAGDNRWTITLTFSPGVSSYVEYKYGAIFDGYDTLTIGSVVSNGSLIDNESRTGVNHTMVLDGASQSIYNHFGDMDPNNPATDVKQIPDGIPKNFDLTQNYPNPFNPTTSINYSIPKNSFVTLKIYNVLGQEVTTLFSGQQRPGNYTATFDASRLASGVYFYRLHAGSFSSVKKMVLMK